MGLCLGPYGGPIGGLVSYGRGTPALQIGSENPEIVHLCNTCRDEISTGVAENVYQARPISIIIRDEGSYGQRAPCLAPQGCKRRGDNSKGFKDCSLKAKAEIWS